MRRARGRSFLGVLVAALVAVACAPSPSSSGTTLVAAATKPTPSAETFPPPARTTPEPPRPTAAPPSTPDPSAGPGETPRPPVEPRDTGGASLDVRATYDVNALISVGTGAVEMAARIEVTNESGEDIDRLELNTIAARLGGIKVTESSVDGEHVKTRVQDQTLIMPLGGVLADGASATILIGYRASLRPGLSGSDWLFTYAGGTIAMHRWIPWVSRAIPFGHANEGLPFVTASSPKVEVEVVTDMPMVLAAPAAKIHKLTAGAGQAWSFTLENVRDVSVVLAPDFGVTEGKVKGVPIRVYSRYGSLSRAGLLRLAKAAVRRDAQVLRVDYPWPVLTVVETEGGDGLESPGLVWIPKGLDSLNRSYLVHHVVAHQWFYGLVGYNQRTEPFAGEAIADLLARTATRTLRSSSCPTARLDLGIGGYSTACYYEGLKLEGALVLDRVRQQMGSNRFWAAVRGYLEKYRYGIAGTKEILEALRGGSDANIGGILRARFPGLY